MAQSRPTMCQWPMNFDQLIRLLLTDTQSKYQQENTNRANESRGTMSSIYGLKPCLACTRKYPEHELSNYFYDTRIQTKFHEFLSIRVSTSNDSFLFSFCNCIRIVPQKLFINAFPLHFVSSCWLIYSFVIHSHTHTYSYIRAQPHSDTHTQMSNGIQREKNRENTTE